MLPSSERIGKREQAICLSLMAQNACQEDSEHNLDQQEDWAHKSDQPDSDATHEVVVALLKTQWAVRKNKPNPGEPQQGPKGKVQPGIGNGVDTSIS